MSTNSHDPYHNSLRQLWSEGRAAVNAWLLLGSSYSAELLAGQGFDSLTLDLQHGLMDYQEAVAILQALPRGGPLPLARVPANEPGLMMKLLDAGISGIICPLIEDRAECERFVAACRYPPRGGRSFGPLRGLPPGPDYCQQVNEHILTFAMIETRQGLANLNEILAVDGLDAVLIGPNDLGISMGYRPASEPTEPEVVEAIERILTRTQAHGVKAGIFCSSGAAARQRIEQGFDFVNPGTDAGLLARAARNACAEARGLPPPSAGAVGY